MSLRDYYTNITVTDNITVTSMEQNVTVSAMGLKFNRRYNVTVMVHNGGGSVMLTADISKHLT